MTPEEKGKELVDRFHKSCSMTLAGAHTIFGQMAKGLAIICVDEIIQVVVSAYHKLGCGEIGELKDYIPYQYWNKVKEVIEKT